MEHQGPWGRAGLTGGRGLTGQARPGGPGESLCPGVGVSETAPSLEALSVLQTPALAPGPRGHRGRWQPGLSPAPQPLRDGLDALGRPSQPGAPRELVTWRLAGGASRGLGCEPPAQDPSGHDARRSTGATGGLARGSEAITPLSGLPVPGVH
jgi:hypothetical protein